MNPALPRDALQVMKIVRKNESTCVFWGTFVPKLLYGFNLVQESKGCGLCW